MELLDQKVTLGCIHDKELSILNVNKVPFWNFASKVYHGHVEGCCEEFRLPIDYFLRQLTSMIKIDMLELVNHHAISQAWCKGF